MPVLKMLGSQSFVMKRRDGEDWEFIISNSVTEGKKG
jgi:hypothetical protein